MSDAVEALLEEVEETADVAVRYGRSAGFMSALESVFLVLASASATAYLHLHSLHFAAVAAASAAAAYAAGRMRARFHRSALDTVDRLKRYARMAVLTARLDQLTEEMEKEIEEMEQILKKAAQN